MSSAISDSDAVQTFILHHVKDSHVFAPFPYWHVPLPAFLTVHGLMMVLAAFVILLVFGLLYRKQDRVPHGFTNLLEVLVVFIRDQISINYLGEADGRRMAPLFCSFFFFILTMNLMGLVPCFAAATSNLSVTAALALVTFVFMVGGGIYRTGLKGFIKGFIPPGVPVFALIVLLPVEIVSLFIKTGALMIRLFANELAGHLVILSLLGLVLMLSLIHI